MFWSTLNLFASFLFLQPLPETHKQKAGSAKRKKNRNLRKANFFMKIPILITHCVQIH